MINTYATVASETLSSIALLILLYGNIYETRRNSESVSKRMRLYSVMVIVLFIGTIFDALSWAVEGHEKFAGLVDFSTWISIIDTYLMMSVLALYIAAILQERSNVNILIFKLYHYAAVISAIITTALYKKGLLYEVRDYVYEETEFYTVYTMGNILFVVIMLIIVTYFRKVLGRHDVFALYAYIAMPVISAIITVFFPEFSLVYPAMFLSLLVIFIMLQTDTANKLVGEKNESVYNASHDELTGLLSRRAYVDKLNSIAESVTASDEPSAEEASVGIIFADVNGLKYTNDHYGHAEGDKLLVKFADIASGLFRDNEIFRVSGDEFVILMPGVGKAELIRRSVQLESRLAENNWLLASVGCEYGLCKDVNALVVNAENNMYVKKEAFYKTHPEMER